MSCSVKNDLPPAFYSPKSEAVQIQASVTQPHGVHGVPRAAPSRRGLPITIYPTFLRLHLLRLRRTGERLLPPYSGLCSPGMCCTLPTAYVFLPSEQQLSVHAVGQRLKRSRTVAPPQILTAVTPGGRRIHGDGVPLSKRNIWLWASFPVPKFRGLVRNAERRRGVQKQH